MSIFNKVTKTFQWGGGPKASSARVAATQVMCTEPAAPA